MYEKDNDEEGKKNFLCQTLSVVLTATKPFGEGPGLPLLKDMGLIEAFEKKFPAVFFIIYAHNWEATEESPRGYYLYSCNLVKPVTEDEDIHVPPATRLAAAEELLRVFK